MNSMERLAILTRANAAITWAAAGDRDKTAENWDSLVQLVRGMSSTQ